MNPYWDEHTDFFGHKRVNEGDHLTVLAQPAEGEWLTEYVIAHATASADRFGWRTQDGSVAGITFYVYEDIRWCRGWVTGEAKNALIVAHALARAA